MTNKNYEINNIYNKDNKPKGKNKLLKKILIIVAVIVILFFVCLILTDYIIINQNEKMNLVINNNNITANMKNDIYIDNNIIYLSEADISNFFDKYIYLENENGKMITTYDKKIAEIGFDKNVININGSDKKIDAHAIKKDNVVYLPISEMKDVYNIEITTCEDTKTIMMDSLDREQIQCTVKSDSPIKITPDFITGTVARVGTGAQVVKIKDIEDGWTKVRTMQGKVGYIKSDKLANEITTRQSMGNEKQVEGKINMYWDFYSMYNKAPDRSGTKTEGVNVVSPSFFYIDKNGELKENIGKEGEAYIEWAHNNGYKVWPIVSNAGDEMINTTSYIMNSYKNRRTLIDSIANACVKYNLDGINIDFENMKQEDKDLFSRFVIELTPMLKDNGDVTTVDVTAPDGGETWSMCYDRRVIGNVADYIVFMAYDEYGVSSTKAGTTAGYDWMKLSLNKFLTTEEIKPEKIILGLPVYTRLWEEAEDRKCNK